MSPLVVFDFNDDIQEMDFIDLADSLPDVLFLIVRDRKAGGCLEKCYTSRHSSCSWQTFS